MRGLLGATVEEVAKAVDVTPARYASWEAGTARPTVDEFLTLCAAVGASEDELSVAAET